MRRAARRYQGLVVLRGEDVRDDWTRGRCSTRPTGCTAAGQDHAGERRHQVLQGPRPRARGGAREGSGRPDRGPSPDRRHGGQDAAVRRHYRGHARCGTGLPGGFHLAGLDPIRARPMLRVPGTGREPDLTERQLDARRRVHKAMQALGGIGSPAGSCIWHVLGCGVASGSGRSVRAGAGGRCVKRRLRGSWSRPWECWPGTTATGGRPESSHAGRAVCRRQWDGIQAA